MSEFTPTRKRTLTQAPAPEQVPVSASRRSTSPRPGASTEDKEKIRRRVEQIRDRIGQSPEKAAIILTEWLKSGTLKTQDSAASAASHGKKPTKKAS